MTDKRSTLLKKITLAEVAGLKRASGGFKPKVHFGADDNGHFPPFLICRIVGVASSYKTGDSTYGPFLRFLGNFAATNNAGEVFRSPNAILPGPADELLKVAIDGADGKPVELAFDIIAIPDAGDRGYKYQVQPLMERAPSDPLDALMADVNDKFALPAPKAAQQDLLPPAGEPDPAPTADKAAKKK